MNQRIPQVLEYYLLLCLNSLYACVLERKDQNQNASPTRARAKVHVIGLLCVRATSTYRKDPLARSKRHRPIGILYTLVF
jgi:hypothetical protein